MVYHSGNLQVDELGVVHLQKHTGDLSSELGVDGLDLGEDHLSENLLLLGGLSGSELRLDQSCLARVLTATGLVRTATVAASIGVSSAARVTLLAVVGREPRHSTVHRGRDGSASTLRRTSTAAGESGLLGLLHGSHELGSTRLTILRRELVGHAVQVGGKLLRNAAATLLRVTRELARTTTLDTGHTHSRLREGNSTASGLREELRL